MIRFEPGIIIPANDGRGWHYTMLFCGVELTAKNHWFRHPQDAKKGMRERIESLNKKIEEGIAEEVYGW